MAPTTLYKVSIDFGSSKAKGEGATLLEALKSIQRPAKIVGKTFLVATYGTKKAERLFMPAQAKRLFYPLSQMYIAKQLGHLLK